MLTFTAMKCLLILLICILAMSVSGQLNNNFQPPVAADDGRPGCATRYEFRRLWRNNLLPEQYWQCTQWQVPAQVRYCPVATRFQDAWQTCVPFKRWEWMPYFSPPTRPGDHFLEQCEEVIVELPDECKTTETTQDPATITPGHSTTPIPVTTTPISTPPSTTEGTTTFSPSTTEPDTTVSATTGTTTIGTPPSTTTTYSPSTPGVDTTTVSVTTEITTIGTIPLETSTQEMTPTTSTEVPALIFECIGATGSQHFPGWTNCSEPPSADSCNILTINSRVATPDPYLYLECSFLHGWIHQQCTDDTCFDGARSRCVAPRSWRNSCRA